MSVHYTVIVTVNRVDKFDKVTRNGLASNTEKVTDVECVMNVATVSSDPVVAITKAMRLLDVELKEHEAAVRAAYAKEQAEKEAPAELPLAERFLP